MAHLSRAITNSQLLVSRLSLLIIWSILVTWSDLVWQGGRLFWARNSGVSLKGYQSSKDCLGFLCTSKKSWWVLWNSWRQGFLGFNQQISWFWPTRPRLGWFHRGIGRHFHVKMIFRENFDIDKFGWQFDESFSLWWTYYTLIGGLEVWNIFYFPYIGNHNPKWLSYFQRGWNHQPGMMH
jgi:hypothetical protein